MSDAPHQWTVLDALGAKCSACGLERRVRGEGRARLWVFFDPRTGKRWTNKARFGGACPRPVAAPRD